MRERAYRRWSSQQLAFAALEGDHEARNALYLRHRRRISMRITSAKRLAAVLEARGAPIAPEDVEQEAFIIFCRLLEEWQPERAPFVPFLIKMLPHAAYQYVRGMQHLRSKRVRWGDAPRKEDEATTPLAKGRLLPTSLPVDETVLSNEAWNHMVGHLSADWARLVHLRYREDRSSSQIARSEGCSQRTVDRALQCALASIQDFMQEEMDADCSPDVTTRQPPARIRR